MDLDVLLNANTSGGSVTPTAWSLAAANAGEPNQYPANAHLKVVDEDGILSSSVLTGVDCGPPAASNRIEVLDADNVLVLGCPSAE